MGAVRSDKNISIIHSTPVHQLTSGEDKILTNPALTRFTNAVNGCRQISIIHSTPVHQLTSGEDKILTNPALTRFTNAVNGCRQISIIHSTPVHQLTSGEDKRLNKSSINTFYQCSEWVPSDLNNTQHSSPSVNIWRRQNIKQIQH